MKRPVALPIVVALLVVAVVLIVYAFRIPSSPATAPGPIVGTTETRPPATFPLHDAVARGDLPVVRDLLAAGADVNARLPLEGANLPGGGQFPGATPLILAAAGPNTDLVRVLLSAGARVDAAGQDGTTPLLAAVRFGPRATVELLAREAAVDARDSAGISAAMVAVMTGQIEKLAVLLDAGASVDAPDASGTTLLGLAAASECDPAILRLLLQAGAKVDVPDAQGVTPLMKAAARDDLEKVVLLLDAGASVGTRDAAGRSVLDWARTRSAVQKSRTLQVLVDAGAG